MRQDPSARAAKEKCVNLFSSRYVCFYCVRILVWILHSIGFKCFSFYVHMYSLHASRRELAHVNTPSWEPSGILQTPTLPSLGLQWRPMRTVIAEAQATLCQDQGLNRTVLRPRYCTLTSFVSLSYSPLEEKSDSLYVGDVLPSLRTSKTEHPYSMATASCILSLLFRRLSDAYLIESLSDPCVFWYDIQHGDLV